MDHRDARVRREAFPLAIQEGGARERTLATGLADPDERLLRMALLEVMDSVPETLVPVLVSRVVKSDRPSDLRSMGVRALRSSRSPLALEALLGVCVTGKSILGKRKLAAPSPEVISALEVLASTWSEDPRARAVLSAARRSKSPEIRKAALSQSSP
jgi:hypothetical protein